MSSELKMKSLILFLFLFFQVPLCAQSGWWTSVSTDYSWGDWNYTGYDEEVFNIKPVFAYTVSTGVDLSDNISVETSFYYSKPTYADTYELHGYQERIFSAGFSFTYYW